MVGELGTHRIAALEPHRPPRPQRRPDQRLEIDGGINAETIDTSVAMIDTTVVMIDIVTVITDPRQPGSRATATA